MLQRYKHTFKNIGFRKNVFQLFFTRPPSGILLRHKKCPSPEKELEKQAGNKGQHLSPHYHIRNSDVQTPHDQHNWNDNN